MRKETLRANVSIEQILKEKKGWFGKRAIRRGCGIIGRNILKMKTKKTGIYIIFEFLGWVKDT